MREMNPTEFQAVKEWYKEWVRFPQYSITAALAILAFSLTNFVLKNDGKVIEADTTYVRLSWILLGVSTLLSSIGMFAAYGAFDIGARLHLPELLQSLHMEPPASDTPGSEDCPWLRGFLPCLRCC